MCFGYSDLTLLSLLAAPAAMLTVSRRDLVDRLTGIDAKLDCRDFPQSALMLNGSTAQIAAIPTQTAARNGSLRFGQCPARDIKTHH
jgi:hypothetical protein